MHHVVTVRLHVQIRSHYKMSILVSCMAGDGHDNLLQSCKEVAVMCSSFTGGKLRQGLTMMCAI